MSEELSTGVLLRGRACRTPVVGPARALLAAAEGWWTVAYVVPVERQRRVEDGVDDDGRVIRRMEARVEENLVVRGWSAQGRQFLAAWASGKAECAYWWQREQEAWADLPRELVRWETPVPVPTRVSFAELRRRLKEK